MNSANSGGPEGAAIPLPPTCLEGARGSVASASPGLRCSDPHSRSPFLSSCLLSFTAVGTQYHSSWYGALMEAFEHSPPPQILVYTKPQKEILLGNKVFANDVIT